MMSMHNRSIIAEFDDMSKDLDDPKQSVSELPAKLDTLQRPISSFPSETDETLCAQQWILELHERALRRNNIIVVSVAEDDSCSTYDAIQKLFAEKLNTPGLFLSKLSSWRKKPINQDLQKAYHNTKAAWKRLIRTKIYMAS